MTTNLDIAIELSDLFEATDMEGTPIAHLIDTEILSIIKYPLTETDMNGIADRFAKVIEKTRAAIIQHPDDRIRRLKDMMKTALLTYAQKTNDIMTSRAIWHRAIKAGGDTMLTVTAGAILANILSGHYSEQAKALLGGIAKKLSGAQAVIENSSSAAVSSGAIAAAPGKTKKRRQDSIFAETDALSFRDLLDNPAIIEIIEDIARCGHEKEVDGVLVDPTTAELVLSVYKSLSPVKQRHYEKKNIGEMINIADKLVERGIISVVMEIN